MLISRTSKHDPVSIRSSPVDEDLLPPLFLDNFFALALFAPMYERMCMRTAPWNAAGAWTENSSCWGRRTFPFPSSARLHPCNHGIGFVQRASSCLPLVERSSNLCPRMSNKVLVWHFHEHPSCKVIGRVSTGCRRCQASPRGHEESRSSWQKNEDLPLAASADGVLLHIHLDCLAVVQVLQGDLVGYDAILTLRPWASIAWSKVEAEHLTGEELGKHIIRISGPTAFAQAIHTIPVVHLSRIWIAEDLVPEREQHGERSEPRVQTEEEIRTQRPCPGTSQRHQDRWYFYPAQRRLGSDRESRRTVGQRVPTGWCSLA